MPYASGDPLSLTEADVRILNTGEERVARYCYRALNGRELRFPLFCDPERPGDYMGWLHEGWGAVAVWRM